MRLRTPVPRDRGFPPGYYDKHLTRNPVARWMLRGHYRTIEEYVEKTGGRRVLEIGCNRGAILERIEGVAERVVGCDVDIEALRLGRRLLGEESLFAGGSAFSLPFREGAFDVVVLCEILEHLDAPGQALEEAARLRPKAVILSVPREPLWRVLNMARGAYWSALGNTPGHVQHFSTLGFLRFVERYFRVLEVRTPTPWTMVLAAPRGG